jgi:serine/threonine-protein kinase
VNALLARASIDEPAEAFLRSIGDVFAVFDARTQDSGNISYGVALGGQRYFVKTAGSLDHAARIALLRNAIDLARSCEHPCLPVLHAVIEAPAGPLLVYGWVDGELLGAPAARRADPACALQRFRALPVREIERCLDAVFEVHRRLASAGWIAADFYDGSLLYDFATTALHVIDLDHYHRGPVRNTMGRMFGSTRFMAPEEHELGAQIDERTSVYTLGRTALVLLSDGTEQAFRGSPARLEVVRRATQPDRDRRYASVADLDDAWRRFSVP